MSSVELVHEVVVTLGSFSHGTADNVFAVLSTRALPLLINGQYSPLKPFTNLLFLCVYVCGRGGGGKLRVEEFSLNVKLCF